MKSHTGTATFSLLAIVTLGKTGEKAVKFFSFSTKGGKTLKSDKKSLQFHKFALFFEQT